MTSFTGIGESYFEVLRGISRLRKQYGEFSETAFDLTLVMCDWFEC